MAELSAFTQCHVLKTTHLTECPDCKGSVTWVCFKQTSLTMKPPAEGEAHKTIWLGQACWKCFKMFYKKDVKDPCKYNKMGS